MENKDFQLLKENYLDTSDYLYLEEAKKEGIVNSMKNWFFLSIIARMPGTKFSKINASKGDFNKFSSMNKYHPTAMIKLAQEDFGGPFPKNSPIDYLSFYVLKTHEILLKHAGAFKAAYPNDDMVKILYLTTVAAMTEALTSIIIAVHFNDPDKLLRGDSVSVDQLSNFIKMDSSGELRKVLNAHKAPVNMKESAEFTFSYKGSKMSAEKIGKTIKDFGGEVFDNIKNIKNVSTGKKAIAIGAVSIATLISIKQVIYWFYYGRNSVDNYLNILADYVELHSLKNTTDPKVRAKQEAIVTKLRSAADKIAVNKVNHTKIKETVKKEVKQASKDAKKSESEPSNDIDILL